jgi:hypothetical protein
MLASTASENLASGSLTGSARDVAVLPGKTGPASLEPGLTGTGLTELGSTGTALKIGSMAAGSLEAAFLESGSLESDFSQRWIRPPPGQPSSSRQTILYCRETARESGHAATRWSVPAPRSASSSGRRKSETGSPTAATSRASWEQRGRPSLIRWVRIPSQTVSSSGTPIFALNWRAPNELHPGSQ